MIVLLDNCTRNAGLVVLRALARRGHEIIATDDRALPFGLRSRFAARYEPLPRVEVPGFGDALLELIRRYRPDVVLPTMASFAISRERERFARETAILVPSFESYKKLDDKQTLLEQCAEFGVPHPRLLQVEEATRLLSSGSSEAAVVKPRINLGGGRGVHIVSNADDLARVHAAVAREHRGAIVCEYVPGPDSDSFALQLLLDRDSRPIAAFTYQKTRQSPLRIGVTAAGISQRRPELLHSVLPMLRELEWVGPADIEFKRDAADGRMKLIEINARFSGAVAFAMGCGVDLPGLACRAAIGEKLPEVSMTAYSEGVKYWNPPYYVRSVWQELVERRTPLATLRAVAGELAGKRIGTPYAFSDLAPSIGKILFSLREKLSRIAS